MHEHVLAGCKPRPLAGYLKALGVLRLVAEQKDSKAKGWWGPDGVFRLKTFLTIDGLEDFFLDDYAPTPIAAPWNGGSGFYPKDNRKALDAILASTSERFRPYRDAIAEIQSWRDIWEGPAGFSDKERRKYKPTIIMRCRARMPDSCLPWLDAACFSSAEGRLIYSPLLGTGGNEGRLELSNNFMQRLVELFLGKPRDVSRPLLKSSLHGIAVPGLVEASIGQYDPGRAGGFNQGMGVEDKDFKINPWDYILTMEGILVLAGAITRRQVAGESSQASSPFTVSFSPVGFNSSEYQESGRGETWLPLWPQPSNYAEIAYLFGEGRSTLNRRAARTGLEFSRAVSSLGVDRGITAFERFVFLERRGKSYVALPAGRIAVQYKPDLELLNELDGILAPLDRFLRGFPKKIPSASFSNARWNIDEAAYACTQRPDADRFNALIRALGRMEMLIALRDRKSKPNLNRPLSGLSPAWIQKADDGDIEVRLAAALSSIQAIGAVGPLRAQMAGVDSQRPWQWGEEGSKVWVGSRLTDRLGNVLVRRLQEAERSQMSYPPFEAYIPLCAADVMPFLWGLFQETRLEELLWGFSLIDWRKGGLQQVKRAWEKPKDEAVLSRTFALLKLLHPPKSLPGKKMKTDFRIAHLLRAGRVNEACRLAKQRLMVMEAQPLEADYQENLDPFSNLASLLIPVRDVWRLERLVLADTHGKS